MQKFGMDYTKTSQEALQNLLCTLKTWLDDSYERNKSIPWKGEHDEGSYLTSWREYYLHTKDEKVINYAKDMINKSQIYIKKNFYHGYHPKQEIHHGTVHFTIFLAWLTELDSFTNNDTLHSQLRNAGNNIIFDENNSKKIPQWYDSSTNRFISTHLGSKTVIKKRKRKMLSSEINLVEHLRMIRLAWLALDCGGKGDLKDVIINYSKEWVKQILNTDAIPVYLDSGMIDEKLFKKTLHTFLGAAPKTMNSSTRSEIHISNGTPDLFLDLYEETKDSIYLKAVEKILSPVISQLDSPYSHPLGDLVWRTSQ